MDTSQERSQLDQAIALVTSATMRTYHAIVPFDTASAHDGALAAGATPEAAKIIGAAVRSPASNESRALLGALAYMNSGGENPIG